MLSSKKILKIQIFLLCTVEKFKFSEFFWMTTTQPQPLLKLFLLYQNSCLAAEVCYTNCADFFPTIILHHCHTKTKTLMNNTFFESPWDDLFTLVVVFQWCDPSKFARFPPGLAIVAGRREIESIRTTNNIWQSAGLQTRKEKKSLVMTTWIKKMKKRGRKNGNGTQFPV